MDTFNYFIQRVSPGWWIAAIIIFLMLTDASVFLIKRKAMPAARTVLYAVFAFYLFMVILFTFGTRLQDPGFFILLTPFQSYEKMISSHDPVDTFQVVGNVLLFIPFGLLFPVVRGKEKRCFFYTVRCAFLFSLTIETIQLITRIGCFETDDLINNTIGGIVGYFVFLFFHTVKERFFCL